MSSQQHRRWRETILELDLVASTARADEPRQRGEELERQALALASELDGYQRELEDLGIQLKDPDSASWISRARWAAAMCCCAGGSASPRSSSGTRSTPATRDASHCRRSCRLDSLWLHRRTSYLQPAHETWRSPDGIDWAVDVDLPGSSNAMVIFRHPDWRERAPRPYNWYLSNGPRRAA